MSKKKRHPRYKIIIKPREDVFHWRVYRHTGGFLGTWIHVNDGYSRVREVANNMAELTVLYDKNRKRQKDEEDRRTTVRYL